MAHAHMRSIAVAIAAVTVTLVVLPRNFDGSMGALIAGARAGAPIKRASEDH